MTLLPSRLLPPAMAGTTAHVTAPRRVELGAPGSDPRTPALVLLNFDDSGSLTTGNDPVGARYAEAKRALRHIAAATSTDTQQVAVFRFAYPDIPTVGPLPLHTKKTVEEVLAAVDPHQRVMGTSELTPSMMGMNRLAEQHPGSDRVAVIFSDFELLDSNPAEPYEEIAKFPGLVHAVVLGTPPPEPLIALPNVEIMLVSQTDPPGMLAAALTHSLNRFRRGATRARIHTETLRYP